MAHWNHRVIKRETTYRRGESDEITEIAFGIVEAYYDDAGKLNGYTEDDIAPYGETLEELRENLQRMLKALDKEVLDDKSLSEQSTGTDLLKGIINVNNSEK